MVLILMVLMKGYPNCWNIWCNPMRPRILKIRYQTASSGRKAVGMEGAAYPKCRFCSEKGCVPLLFLWLLGFTINILAVGKRCRFWPFCVSTSEFPQFWPVPTVDLDSTRLSWCWLMLDVRSLRFGKASLWASQRSLRLRPLAASGICEELSESWPIEDDWFWSRVPRQRRYLMHFNAICDRSEIYSRCHPGSYFHWQIP